jgi:hypothetical protein
VARAVAAASASHAPTMPRGATSTCHCAA